MIKELLDLVILDLDEAIGRGKNALDFEGAPQKEYLRKLVTGLQAEKDACTQFRATGGADNISRYDHEEIDKFVNLILRGGVLGTKLELYFGMNFMTAEFKSRAWNIKEEIETWGGLLDAGEFADEVSNLFVDLEVPVVVPRVDEGDGFPKHIQDLLNRGEKLVQIIREKAEGL